MKFKKKELSALFTATGGTILVAAAVGMLASPVLALSGLLFMETGVGMNGPG